MSIESIPAIAAPLERTVELWQGIGVLAGLSVLTILLIPDLSIWVSTILRAHSAGTRAFWKGLGIAAQDYRRASAGEKALMERSAVDTETAMIDRITGQIVERAVKEMSVTTEKEIQEWEEEQGAVV